MQPGVSGMQYGTPGDPQWHDDDMLQAGIQVAPNLDDQPEARQIEYWFIVESAGGPSGIADAVIRVYAPGGELAQEIPAVQRGCAELGAPAEIGSVLDAAVRTEQISLPAAEATAVCDVAARLVFSAVGELSVSAPAGEYQVESVVTDVTGTVSASTSHLENLPVIGVQISSDQIDFGEIEPDTWNATTSPYHVRNTGNVGGHVNLRFSSMVGFESGETITEFGVIAGAEEMTTVAANVTVCFNQSLGSNETRELRLFAHPEAIRPDAYTGRLSVSMTASCAA